MFAEQTTLPLVQQRDNITVELESSTSAVAHVRWETVPNMRLAIVDPHCQPLTHGRARTCTLPHVAAIHNAIAPLTVDGERRDETGGSLPARHAVCRRPAGQVGLGHDLQAVVVRQEVVRGQNEDLLETEASALTLVRPQQAGALGGMGAHRDRDRPLDQQLLFDLHGAVVPAQWLLFCATAFRRYCHRYHMAVFAGRLYACCGRKAHICDIGRGQVVDHREKYRATVPRVVDELLIARFHVALKGVGL